MIKFWAWVYRKTGWYSPWARAAELDHIKNYLNRRIELAQTYLNEQVHEELVRVDIEFGMWQAHHGFYTIIKDLTKLGR